MQTRSFSASRTAWFPGNDARREHSTAELNRALIRWPPRVTIF